MREMSVALTNGKEQRMIPMSPAGVGVETLKCRGPYQWNKAGT
jgi:hypothetical protein